MAALNRLNDLTMLETLVIEVKQVSESLKKNVEENSENASKKMVALMKDYATIVTAHASSIVAASEAASDVDGSLEAFGFLNCNLLAKVEKDKTFNEDATVQKNYDAAKDSFKDVAIKARVSHCAAESPSRAARKWPVVGSSTSDPDTGISVANGA